jgi:hypothetical protein
MTKEYIKALEIIKNDRSLGSEKMFFKKLEVFIHSSNYNIKVA